MPRQHGRCVLNVSVLPGPGPLEAALPPCDRSLRHYASYPACADVHRRCGGLSGDHGDRPASVTGPCGRRFGGDELRSAVRSVPGGDRLAPGRRRADGPRGGQRWCPAVSGGSSSIGHACWRRSVAGVPAWWPPAVGEAGRNVERAPLRARRCDDPGHGRAAVGDRRVRRRPLPRLHHGRGCGDAGRIAARVRELVGQGTGPDAACRTVTPEDSSGKHANSTTRSRHHSDGTTRRLGGSAAAAAPSGDVRRPRGPCPRAPRRTGEDAPVRTARAHTGRHDRSPATCADPVTSGRRQVRGCGGGPAPRRNRRTRGRSRGRGRCRAACGWCAGKPSAAA
ncbi:hypothetical protein EDD40_0264 [Saccharothrix texasensis]|uniref:Uncharacterized protein n=1 Tax=Saccharothrix texasensis TaxID=103734 RepID=A0A3N1GXJ2_9PSEU|nr:hypothetical protein EDD40_0264 [Saccharothrix texasensis]